MVYLLHMFHTLGVNINGKQFAGNARLQGVIFIVEISGVFISKRNKILDSNIKPKPRTKFCPMQVRFPILKGRKCGRFFLI